MPIEFPDDFTAFPGTPAATDYVMLNKYKAQLGDLASVFNAPATLAEWNGTSTTQFGTANSFGGAIAPTLTAVANSTGLTSLLRAKLGNLTPAGGGAIWWFTDTASFQSMSIRFGISSNATNPIQTGETLVAGLVFAGDAATGSSLGLGVVFDDTQGATSVILTGNDAYGTNAFTTPVTVGGGTYRITQFDFNGALRDTAGYPTLGCPMLAGVVQSTGLLVGLTESDLLIVNGSSGLAAGIGANPTNRIGVFVVTTTGLTADTSLDLTQISVQAYTKGSP
jgi:hypothetical protein